MIELEGLRVVVAGAGAVGSVAALALARAGAEVTLVDPSPVGDNASGVAAGMLAPASEALLDPVARDHLSLLREARDLWPALAASLPGAPPIDRSGAYIAVDEPQPFLSRATAMGVDLTPGGDGLLHTAEDWRLEPLPMLAALHAALRDAGGHIVADRATGLRDGRVELASGAALAADRLVLATGWGLGLTPIKGQILRFPGLGPASGPVLRGHGAYAAPGATGLTVGATMEEGVSDLAIDPAAVERLRAAAVRLAPATVGARFEVFAGIRAATPDGLPLVGVQGEGVLVARGARRNGWLLAPLIARVLLASLSERTPDPAAPAFDPGRFR